MVEVQGLSHDIMFSCRSLIFGLPGDDLQCDYSTHDLYLGSLGPQDQVLHLKLVFGRAACLSLTRCVSTLGVEHLCYTRLNHMALIHLS